MVPTLSKNQKRRQNRKAAAEKAAKAAANVELQEEGKFVEEDMLEIPREEVEAPEAKRRFNALDGDDDLAQLDRLLEQLDILLLVRQLRLVR